MTKPSRRRRANGEGSYYFEERTGKWVGAYTIRAGGKSLRKYVRART